MNEHKQITTQDGAFIVNRFRIIGTETVVYAAYEPSAIMGNHSSLTTFDGEWYGKVTSRSLTAEVDAIPVGPERFEACRLHRAGLEGISYRAIYAAYPHLSGVENYSRDGEIMTKE